MNVYKNSESKTNNRLNNKGFTLVELIVTMAIMAIVLSLIIIGRDSISKANISRSLVEFKGIFEDTRQKAMFKDGFYYLDYVENEDGFITFRQHYRPSVIDESNDTIIKEVDLDNIVQVNYENHVGNQGLVLTPGIFFKKTGGMWNYDVNNKKFVDTDLDTIRLISKAAGTDILVSNMLFISNTTGYITLEKSVES